MGQKSRSGLARWFCLKVSHEFVIKVSTGPWKVWRMCFQGDLLTVWHISAGCGPSSSPSEPCYRANWVSSQHGAWLPIRQAIQVRARPKLPSLSWPNMGVTFSQFLYVTQITPIQDERGLHRVWIMGSLQTVLETRYCRDFASIIFSNWYILPPDIPMACACSFFSFKSWLKCHFFKKTRLL